MLQHTNVLRLQQVSNWDDREDAFVMPPKATVLSKRVVVTTCLMASKVSR